MNIGIWMFATVRATWWNVQREFYALKRMGHNVKRNRPFSFRKYGPVIHIHDKTEREIVHFYSGPYDDESLFELQRELAEIRSAYIRRSHVDSIRLVLVKGSSVVIPDWFIPTTRAMLPEVE